MLAVPEAPSDTCFVPGNSDYSSGPFTGEATRSGRCRGTSDQTC
jgi:hypothetical protein